MAPAAAAAVAPLLPYFKAQTKAILTQTSATMANNNHLITTSPTLSTLCKSNELRLLQPVPVKREQVLNRVRCFSPPSVGPDSSAVDPLPLKIGIIGFGNFGQFISTAFKGQGHNVLATSRSDYSDYCQLHGIEFYRNIDALCEEQPDVILVCSSILSTETVVRGIPMHKLKPDTIFADVLSVKQFPRNLFLEVLPSEFGIVCTHPMFGPESGKHGWTGLPFVYDKVRIAENTIQERKCAQFLSIFEQEGCRMVEMSCEEHDRHAAGSQFITHTIGRILSYLNLESTPINTKGYETLLQLTENTVSDSFDLYHGLFMYNVNATQQIDNLDRAFEIVKQKLFGRLHDILRKQIVERVPLQGTSSSPSSSSSTNPQREHKNLVAPYFLTNSEKMKDLSSFAMPTLPQHNNESNLLFSGLLKQSVNRKIDLPYSNVIDGERRRQKRILDLEQYCQIALELEEYGLQTQGMANQPRVGLIHEFPRIQLHACFSPSSVDNILRLNTSSNDDIWKCTSTKNGNFSTKMAAKTPCQSITFILDARQAYMCFLWLL
ncbi:arogenate dehydrogenase 2, chloroplastic-like [Telopea speciosissima]|nr:arogenate dehydrogenase 2, chloroplastic-like [Telopea speciosissima]